VKLGRGSCIESSSSEQASGERKDRRTLAGFYPPHTGRFTAPRRVNEEVAMSPFYPWFLFLHILAALWFAAGVFASAVVRVQGRRAAGPERALATRLLWRLHVIYTLPGLLVAGFLGFYLVAAGGFRFAETWVLAAAMLYLLMFLSTLFAVTPGLARQRAAAARIAGGAANADDEAALAAKGPSILTHVNALIIVILICLMAVKP
jgi:small-conductance mechanosensitive channel